MEITFLGTGASGGTEGTGKSERLESSVLIKDSINLLIDVTRDFNKQAKDLKKIDAILITHGHMDACGGIGKLQDWLMEHNVSKIPLFAHAKTIDVIRAKFKLSGIIKLIQVKTGQKIRLGPLEITSYKISHSKNPKFPTFAWKLRNSKALVYASDIAELTKGFKEICQRIDLLIIDGATWKRKIYTHLRIDQDLPKICRWPVSKIILTQIGKSVPPYEKLCKNVAKICPKASSAYDGFNIVV